MKVRSSFGLQQRSTRFFTSVLWLSVLVFVGGCVVGRAAPQASTPVITSVTPNSIVAGSQSTVITVVGSGFTSDSVIEWNGASLSSNLFNGSLSATVSASDLSTVGTATVQVDTPTAIPALSNAIMLQIPTPPAPTLGSVSPYAGPINTEALVTLAGTGFTLETTVAVNGVIVPSNFVSSGTITATIPAANLALPGNVNISVTTPASGAGPSPALTYTAYIEMANNDIVYNAVDVLLYASVPVTGAGTGGNTVVGIDPVTGAVRRTIQVGSGPDKLALSTDGRQLFVGLNGAASVAQVNLSQGVVVNQFYLGGGQGIYNPPYTATALAAIPGEPNSVVVSSTADIAIYDSGVARAKTVSGSVEGLSFGSSSSVLYAVNGGQVLDLTVDSTGITETSSVAIGTAANSIQYDSGRLYLSSGQVLDSTTGDLLGTFYSNGDTPASGAVVSDSSLGRAFIGTSGFSSSGQVSAFNESTFTLKGTIAAGLLASFQKIVRWGQDGLALSAGTQIYVFQSNFVKNLDSSPADLSVTLTAPATATTGSATSWVATVSNLGPNEAKGVTLVMSLDSSMTTGKVSTSQGACGTGAQFVCDLGNLATGASATVTVQTTPRSEGTFAGVAYISSISYDPKTSNNRSTTSTTVTGNLYNPPPTISAISPNLVQAGSAEFTLTVTGGGFNANSVVHLGSAALTTTMVSATQLTATVPAAEIGKYGWAQISVSNPGPGGGVTQVLPLTIYAVVNVPANAIAFDPYSQLLYAAVPSAATNIAGNSVVSINPSTGAVGSPVFVGSQPTVMAETSDGNYLFIGLSGANSLAQFDLEQRKLIATIPLSLQQGEPTSVTASWLATMPGSDTTLAVNTEGEGGTFGIFDISGETGSFRPNLSGIYQGVNPVFASASLIYAYDSQTSGAEFYRYGVNTDGVTLIDGTTLDGMGGFSGLIDLGSNGLVYGSAGGIVNPMTTPPSQIATLPLFDFYYAGSDGSGVAAAADPSLQREFLMLENGAGTWAYGLVRYNLNTYLPETVLDMPQSASSVLAGWTMLRFGQDGLALLSVAENYGTGQLDTVLMLLRGPFVTPQLLKKNSAATLTSSSVASISHDSGNTILTLTGSNFQPGVAVTWNGSYRTTTIVDSSHVTIDIPASDLVHAGTVSLVATNPGASASDTLKITID